MQKTRIENNPGRSRPECGQSRRKRSVLYEPALGLRDRACFLYVLALGLRVRPSVLMFKVSGFN